MVRLLAADWNHWPDGLEAAEIARVASRAGVDGIELGVYDTAVELADERLAEWRRLGDEHAVPVQMFLYSMTPDRWPGGGLSNETAHPRLFAEVEALLETAARVGLDTVGLWPGADLAGADRAVFAAATSRLSLLAHRIGVRIALEPKPDTLVACVEDVPLLSDDAAEPDSIGVLLDTGHEYAGGRQPELIVPALGPRLFHVHLGDSDGDPDADLPPGRLHPLEPFLAALDSVGYAGAMSPDAYGAVASRLITGEGVLAETVRQVGTYRQRWSR